VKVSIAFGVLLFVVLGCAAFVIGVYVMETVHTDVVRSCTIGD